MSFPNLLIYLMRRDLRLQDNPVFHEATNLEDFTHLLPVYVFPAQQIEVSGFIPKNIGKKSPYPEARSAIGGFWRCGKHRVKFLAESIWDLKQTLEDVGSGLEIRVGMIGEVVKTLLEGFTNGSEKFRVGAVWMTRDETVEERIEERDVRSVCRDAGVELRLFKDEKYFIDDQDVPFQHPPDLPDIFTTYRKSVEPLRAGPRAVLPSPAKSSLPQFPPLSSIPPQHDPFVTPSEYAELESMLISPILGFSVSDPPRQPNDTTSAFPFHGGEKEAHKRLKQLVVSGSLQSYKSSRDSLLGIDSSTKLSAWLALGCLTARQVHSALLDFEDAKTNLGSNAEGYGNGENEGTMAVRFELLWRDYMRLCARKFRHRLFRLGGFRDNETVQWKSISDPDSEAAADAKKMMDRFLNGTTGMGLIDASQRELYLTGYTSNRARQNVASFLTKNLKLDWRLGAEWYECMLIDYDASNNWGNWLYVAGLGNDPRGFARRFNPVKQAWDYDPTAKYVRTWIPELRQVEDPGECFQACTIPVERRARLGLDGLEWVEHPLNEIHFVVGPMWKGRHTRGWRNNQGRSHNKRTPGGDENRSNRRGGLSRGFTIGRGGGRGRGQGQDHARGGRASSRGHTGGPQDGHTTQITKIPEITVTDSND